jgi:hypothetical protein
LLLFLTPDRIDETSESIAGDLGPNRRSDQGGQSAFAEQLIQLGEPDRRGPGGIGTATPVRRLIAERATGSLRTS